MNLPSSMPPPPATNSYHSQSQQDGPRIQNRQQDRVEDPAGKRPELPHLTADTDNQVDKMYQAGAEYSKADKIQSQSAQIHSQAQDLRAERTPQSNPLANSRIEERLPRSDFNNTNSNQTPCEGKQGLGDSGLEAHRQQKASDINVNLPVTDSNSYDKSVAKKVHASSERSSDKASVAKDREKKVHRSRKRSRSPRKKSSRRSRSRRSRSRRSRSRTSRRHSDRHHRRSGSRRDKRSDRHRRHDKKRYEDSSDKSLRSRRHRRASPSSSSSRSGSSSSSSSSSSNDSRKAKIVKKRFNPKNQKEPQESVYVAQPNYRAVHPYFQRRNNAAQESDAKMFWDGFQWVTRQQQVFDVAHNAVDIATKAVTGEDRKQNEERLAASKTVIVENLALDLGLTAKDIQKFLLDQLEKIGEKDIVITDIDMHHGPTSIAVQLMDKSMVDKMKKLDGIHCLGETLKVRRINEETAQTNAQAAAITLAALKALTSGAGEGELNMKASTLKTVNVSSVIKISHIHDREEELTPEIYEEIKEDMEAEFSKIPHLKRVKVVRKGEELLGAEVGAVFVEFRDKKSAELGLKMMRGRIYDGREIMVKFVDEKLYYSELNIA